MLSVAHHPAESPASASQRSALLRSWSPERSSILKRRNVDLDCCISNKKQSTEDAKNYVENIQLRPEVTLTLISKNSNGSHFKELINGKFIISNDIAENDQVDCSTVSEKVEDEEVEKTTDNLTKDQALTYIEKYTEVELLRIKPTGSIKVTNQNELLNAHSTDQISIDSGACIEFNKEDSDISANLVADLPELSIKPCTSNVKVKLQNAPESSPKRTRGLKKTRARLGKAMEMLKQEDVKNDIAISSDLDYYNKSGNLISTPAPIKDETISDSTVYPLPCTSVFDEPQTSTTTTTTSTSAACDYDPLNDVGIPVENYWSKDRPYYVHGLPNPVTENRCWINATLQVLFRLPIFNDLSLLDTPNCSKLIRSLETIQSYWKRGTTRNYAYSTSFNHFKDELSVLDKGYSSKAQQDVSEFILNLLNFIKTELEAKTKESHNHEIENIPNNDQDSPRKSHNASNDSNKRSPLADISSSAGQPRGSHASSGDQQDNVNSKNTSSKSQNDDETEVSNAVDNYFSLYMVENYCCCQCSKKRQQKVENLMLFIDLPSEDCSGTLDLIDMINTTYRPEQRELTCESCKHNRHTMNTKLKKLPKILTVQVKRYEMTNEGIINKKSTAIDIPRLLQLDRLVIQNDIKCGPFPSYELIGIISHIGDSIDSGHYISFVKHKDQWFYYDDANVKLLNEEEVFKCVQNNAYVIFFQEIDFNENDIVSEHAKED